MRFALHLIDLQDFLSSEEWKRRLVVCISKGSMEMPLV